VQMEYAHAAVPAVSNLWRVATSSRTVARWLAHIERDLVLETLAKTDGNRTASARLLGFSIKTCCVIRLRNIQRTALMCHHAAA
jgi:DNA-binding NtrC family response regulator